MDTVITRHPLADEIVHAVSESDESDTKLGADSRRQRC